MPRLASQDVILIQEFRDFLDDHPDYTFMTLNQSAGEIRAALDELAAQIPGRSTWGYWTTKGDGEREKSRLIACINQCMSALVHDQSQDIQNRFKPLLESKLGNIQQPEFDTEQANSLAYFLKKESEYNYFYKLSHYIGKWMRDKMSPMMGRKNVYAFYNFLGLEENLQPGIKKWMFIFLMVLMFVVFGLTGPVGWGTGLILSWLHISMNINIASVTGLALLDVLITAATFVGVWASTKALVCFGMNLVMGSDKEIVKTPLAPSKKAAIVTEGDVEKLVERLRGPQEDTALSPKVEEKLGGGLRADAKQAPNPSIKK